MRTQIDFLQQYREDLLEAAWRESVGGPMKSPRRRWWQGWSRRRILAVATAGTLVVAGLTGFIALRFRDHGGAFNALSRLGNMRSTPQQIARLQHQAGSLHTPAHDQAMGGVLGVPNDIASGSSGRVGGPVTSTLSPDTTKIVKRGSLSIQVPKGSIDRSLQQATDIAARYGGFVQGTSTYGADTGDVDLRVPVSRFEVAVGALSKIGHVTARDITGVDVTARFVDLTGRLQIAKGQRAVLLTLLSKARSIPDILRVQNALNDTQLNIEQLEGQIRLLNNQASQSTIHVSFTTPGAPKAGAATGTQVKNPSFTKGLRTALAGLLDVVVAVLVGLGYLFPIALLGLLVWLLVRRMRRPREA